MSVATAYSDLHLDAGLIDTGMATRASMLEIDRRNSLDDIVSFEDWQERESRSVWLAHPNARS